MIILSGSSHIHIDLGDNHLTLPTVRPPLPRWPVEKVCIQLLLDFHLKSSSPDLQRKFICAHIYFILDSFQMPDAEWDETATASFNSSDTITAWGDEEDEDGSQTEITGIWSDNVGQDNILMVQLPEVKKSRGNKRKRSDDIDNQVRVKRCRATFGEDARESWCKPCRSKKKGATCLRLSSI